MPAPSSRTPSRIAALRGARGRCPSCGRGKLYARYLKQVSTCEVCGAPIGNIRAEDGPPWLTVLLLGPFLAGFTFMAARHEDWPLWITLPALSLLAVAAVLLLLPRIKGAIIGLFWSMGGAEGNEEDRD